MSLQEILVKEGFGWGDLRNVGVLSTFLEDLKVNVPSPVRNSDGYVLESNVNKGGFRIKGSIKISSSTPVQGEKTNKDGNGDSPKTNPPRIETIILSIERKGVKFLDFAYDAGDNKEHKDGFSVDKVGCEVKIHLRCETPHGYRTEEEPVTKVDYRDNSGNIVAGHKETVEDKVAKLHLLGAGWKLVDGDQTFDRFHGVFPDPIVYDTYVLTSTKTLMAVPYLVIDVDDPSSKNHKEYLVADFANDGKISYRLIVVDVKKYESQGGFDRENAYSDAIIAGFNSATPGVTITALDKIQKELRLYGKMEGKLSWLGRIVSQINDVELCSHVGDYVGGCKLGEGLLAVERIIDGYDNARSLLNKYGEHLGSADKKIGEGSKSIHPSEGAGLASPRKAVQDDRSWNSPGKLDLTERGGTVRKGGGGGVSVMSEKDIKDMVTRSCGFADLVGY